ncbi:MAG: SirB1 family protein [Burkholderiales bacterium]
MRSGALDRAMAPLAPFTDLVARGDPKIELARACLLIAEDAYPGLDVDGYVGEVERLAKRLRGRIAHGAAAEEKVIALNEFLFDDLGFEGNTGNYYDPRNSYLNEVIDRRSGIPITLSVLYIEIGRRIGLPLEGVSFPGHFLVRLRVRGGTLVLDPFAGGAPQSEVELRDRLKRVIPQGSTGGVPLSRLPLDQFLEPASNRQILARVLRNLKGIYREADKPERLLAVLNRMIIVAPDSAAELRDRGLVYQRLECWRPALKDLADYLEREPDASDVDEVRAKMMDLSRRCARLN